MARINGVWINGKHSYREYGLFFSRRPEIESAAPKLKLVDVPGGDGTLDYTEAIDGTVKYENRRISIDFFAIVDIPKQSALRAQLKNAWHGRIVEIEFDEEPGWIYKGRATVTPQEVTPHTMHFVLDVDAEPYAISKDVEEIELATKSDKGALGEIYTIPHQESSDEEETDSLWRFNDGQHAYADFSFFSTITVKWPVESWRKNTVRLWIKDITGAYYSPPQPPYHYHSDGEYYFQLGALADHNVDVSKISRIRITGAPNAYIEANRVAAGKTIVVNDDMPVVPEFIKTSVIQGSSTPSQIYLNGRTTNIPASQVRFRDNSLMLLPGENEIFVAPSEEELHSLEVSVFFRPGRL